MAPRKKRLCAMCSSGLARSNKSLFCSVCKKKVKNNTSICKRCNKPKHRTHCSHCASNSQLDPRHRDNYEPEPVNRPTSTRPGDNDRVAVYRQRYEEGRDICHEDDLDLEGHVGGRVER